MKNAAFIAIAISLFVGCADRAGDRSTRPNEHKRNWIQTWKAKNPWASKRLSRYPFSNDLFYESFDLTTAFASEESFIKFVKLRKAIDPSLNHSIELMKLTDHSITIVSPQDSVTKRIKFSFDLNGNCYFVEEKLVDPKSVT